MGKNINRSDHFVLSPHRGVSLSEIVAVPVPLLIVEPALALDSKTEKLSAPSFVASSIVGTLIVLLVSPPRKVSVPKAAVSQPRQGRCHSRPHNLRSVFPRQHRTW